MASPARTVRTAPAKALPLLRLIPPPVVSPRHGVPARSPAGD
jgi:hypothetical protein